jgi:hypothetical protein
MTKTKSIPLPAHRFAGGSAGGAGECSGWCTCGTELAGFDSMRELGDAFRLHVVDATARDRRDRPKVLRVARNRAANRTARISRRVNRKRAA